MFSPPLANQTARLTRLYIIALSVVAMLSIGGQILVQYALRLQQNDATVINVAGRQRMLSQKIVKTALTLLSTQHDSQRTPIVENLQALLTQWHTSHLALQQGSESLPQSKINSAAIQQLFSELNPIHSFMYEAGKNIVASHFESNSSSHKSMNTSISILLNYDPEFLAIMEKIVTQFDSEATYRVTQLQRIELGLLTLTLLVLALEGLFIFRPAVQHIQTAAAALVTSQAAQQTAQIQAEQANLEKSRFLANISHELRTPLHAVRGYTELLLNANLNTDQKSKLAIIHDAALTLTALADDLLDLARIDAGKLEVHLEAINLNSVITACNNLVSHLAVEKCLLLNFVPPMELTDLQVLADPLRLRQILLNLLTNAIKFTPAGHIEIQLSLDSTGERVQIGVHDTGIGIATQDIQLIFDAFQQLETGGRSRGGAGLGLAISRRLAEAMGGTLVVESSLNAGSTFTLELACATCALTEPAHVTPKPLPHTAPQSEPYSLAVLVVDDDPVNRQLLTEALLSWGHRPFVFSTGYAAVEFAASHKIDIALLDIQMPSMSGSELATKLRAQFQEMRISNFPILAISATRFITTEDKVYLFDSYVLKPLSLNELKLQLDSVGTRLVASKSNQTIENEPIHFVIQSKIVSVLERLQGNHSLLQKLIELFLDAWTFNFPNWQKALRTRNAGEVRKYLHLWRGQIMQFNGVNVLQFLDYWEYCSTDEELFSVIHYQEEKFLQAMTNFQNELQAIRTFCATNSEKTLDYDNKA
jgi:signal transduction histidine kinase/CheY-like chemotaxis protein